MALSRVTYESDGTTREFTVSFALGYIDEQHVRAWVRGELNADGSRRNRVVEFISRERVRLLGDIPAAGTAIEFSRVVPKNEELVVFQDGDALNESNLDTVQKQALMTAHEALDDVVESEARLRNEMNGLAEETNFVFLEGSEVYFVFVEKA